MDAELAEIQHYLSVVPPFDVLSLAQLQQVTQLISICYVRHDTALPPANISEPCLYIVRKGALTYKNAQDELLGKYGEGDVCSVFILTNTTVSVVTDEDCLLYVINFAQLKATLGDNDKLLSFFSESAEERLKARVEDINADAIVNSTLESRLIADIYQGAPASIDSKQSIQAAAAMMTDLGFSSLLVKQQEQLVGIITDKDIRKRCVAIGLDFNEPVTTIMTPDISTIDCNSNAFDALVMMTTLRVHHLPVTKNGILVGMITSTDLIQHEGQNAVHVTAVISKAKTVAELVKISKLIPTLQMRMAKMGTTSEYVGKSISAITNAITIKLINMAENLHGPAPVSYAWVSAGSQARQEQYCHSDQDNALIISDDFKPEHDYWFHDLATFVSDGLAACGFIYCPGDVMATNAKWRQPEKVWHNYFAKWIDKPSPKALMNCSIFFDLNFVYGEVELLNKVRERMLEKTQGNSLFLAHLTRNALNLRPPLGFFRDFVLSQNGNNKDSLDLKHHGIAPIVDLARIYALSTGVSAVNTIERLRQTAGTAAVTKSSAANLIDAFEFLGLLRVKHQANKLQQNQAPDNYLSPKNISKLEREHLKDAFKVIKALQDVRQTVY